MTIVELPRQADAEGFANSFAPGLRREVLATPTSGIDEVVKYGRGRQGLISLWVGEGDTPTPAFICEAATRSLAAGETFYTHQRGHPDFRASIARYMSLVYGSPFAGSLQPFDPDRFTASIGGMHALQMAVRLVAGQGDEVIILTPAWPNFAGALAIAGGRAVEVPLGFERQAESWRWSLHVEQLARAVSPATRALFINSPSNPTGWTATLEELSAILALARHYGLWIIADEIYGRITFESERAPSFHDIIDASDRVLFVQTLSKNWAMTGLRCGWLEAPAELGPVIENLVLYSSSGVAVPVQRAAIAALDRGESFVAHQIARFRQSRDILCGGLAASARARFARPDAAMYVFAAIEGEPDVAALALRLVDEANVGVAPGSTFGAGGEAFIRLCFAAHPDQMREATRRLAGWLAH